MPARTWAIGSLCGLSIGLWAVGTVIADDAKTSYPSMAPLARYQIPSPADEIAMARSAAPTSISGNADVLTFSEHGYETAAKGNNGFVCLVWRSWAAGFNDAEFWNPKLRAPICLNAAAVRTILPAYFEKTKWVLSGVSKSDMVSRTKAALSANSRVLPEPGAMGYMMSKQQYLSDEGEHWHPHLMFYVAHSSPGAWGANLAGSPIFSSQDDLESVTTFIVPVTKWSDGTPAAMEMR